MPEVKRREIQRRRAIREKLWRDDDDDDDDDDDIIVDKKYNRAHKVEGSEDALSGFGGGGVGALKRAAKRILVQQLKEWREKEAQQKNRKNKEKKNTHNNYEENEQEDSQSKTIIHTNCLHSTTEAPRGAMAAGFALVDETLNIIGSNATTTTTSSQQQLSTQKNPDGHVPDGINEMNIMDENEESITCVHSNENRNLSHEYPSLSNDSLHHEPHILDENEYDTENDWETSRAVELSMNDFIHHNPRRRQQQQQQQRQQLLSTITNTTSNDARHQHTDDIEAIASLPNEARYQYVDAQWRAHRIQSRQECMQAASNPEEYSMTQLRNFYKSNELAKRVGEINKFVEKAKEEEEEKHRARPALHRLRKQNQNCSDGCGHDDDDDDDEMFVFSNNSAHDVSMKELFEEDDSDEECENAYIDCNDDGRHSEEGGFLLPSASDSNRLVSEVGVLHESNDSDELLQASGCYLKSNGVTESRKMLDCNSQSSLDCHSIHPDRLAKLHALTTAEQEWAEWGGETDDAGSTNVPDEVVEVVNSSSESDDDGLDNTFLVFGEATKPLQSYHSIKKSAKNDALYTRQVAAVQDLKSKDDLKEEEHHDEEEDIEWEDGVSESTSDPNATCKYNNVTVPVQHFHNVQITCDHNASIKNKECSNIKIPSENNNEQRVTEDSSQPFPPKSMVESNVDENDTIHTSDESTSDSIVADKSHALALQDHDTSSDDCTVITCTESYSNFRTTQDQVAEEAQNDVITDHVEAVTTSKNEEVKLNSPSEINRVKLTPTFADTSLQALTDAHNAILKEEKTMERDMTTITDEMKADILDLLLLCGIPWIESPSEAEAQCAALEELGLVDGVVTEDSDIFVFGGRKVYKNFFNEQKYVEAYFAKDIERDLALKKHQLIALAMLLGGDYTDGVKGVGIVNGMEILRAFKIDDSEDGIKVGLQAFRDWLEGFEDPSDDDKSISQKVHIFHKKHTSARTRWVAPVDFPSSAILNAYLKPVVDKSNAKFTWATPDLQGLRSYCAETIGWEVSETDRVVRPVVEAQERGSKQTRIESYFMKYEDNYKFAKVRSKRLKAVLTDIQGEDICEGVDGINSIKRGRTEKNI